jgi:pimeloyl-ACP methyl ester carboxylesterase
MLRKFPAPLSAAGFKLLSLGTVHRLRNVRQTIVHAAFQADPPTAEKLFSDLCSFRHTNQNLSGGKFVPSIVLRGQKDRIVSEATARRLAVSIGAQYVEVLGVGHTPMVESPSAYCAALVGALEKKADEI